MVVTQVNGFLKLPCNVMVVAVRYVICMGKKGKEKEYIKVDEKKRYGSILNVSGNQSG